MTELNYNELRHYGILGMKWGVRRYQNADGTLTRAGKLKRNREEYKINKQKANAEELRSVKDQYKKEKQNIKTENLSEDHKRVQPLKKKKLSELTNAELKELTQRMQLETQYKELLKRDVSKTQKFVGDVVADASKQVATKAVKASMEKEIEVVKAIFAEFVNAR